MGLTKLWLDLRHFWEWKGHYINVYKTADKHRAYFRQTGFYGQPILRPDNANCFSNIWGPYWTFCFPDTTSSFWNKRYWQICILTSIPGDSYPTEVLEAMALLSCLAKQVPIIWQDIIYTTFHSLLEICIGAFMLLPG